MEKQWSRDRQKELEREESLLLDFDMMKRKMADYFSSGLVEKEDDFYHHR
jgi:hypothetical protein